MPTTSSAPVTTTASTTSEAARGQLIIQGVGDLNLDPSYIPNLAVNGYGFAFEGLDGLLLDDDLTVVNLECSPSDLGEPLPKAFSFRCDPDALEVARANGVDVANLANNHGLDYGLDAMLDGREQVEAAGIAPVGVGRDLRQATRPALIETQGWTVAVLGMNGVVSAEWWLADDGQPGMASGDDTEQMVAAVEAADELADLVVVSIHWLWELETEPRADDRERAEAMIAAGADIVFGHHPHRLGEVELIDGRPVFWTLGNFVWPRLSDAGATTAVGRVIVDPDGSIEACLIPAFITTSGQPELTGKPSCG
ncbi:MAG: CapA family protein [Acidimicrobiia bacterium]|nr:CapA family protein [Acidimicrobiia bacterium]